MDKKIIATVLTISLIILILGGMIFSSLGKKNNETEKSIKTPQKNETVFYYGITCPHCKEVEEWMKKNKIEEKIKIEKKEVYQNQKNAQELKKVAEGCGLNLMMIGVPFLYSDGKCYIGTPEVIKKIEEKLNIKN